MSYTDGYWWSNDGIRLHYRDYAGRADRPPILCMPGLTRNARDFSSVAERLAGEWRLICVDFRGRGESGYAKDPMSYAPIVYVQDVERLLAELQIERLIAFGTSLGGIVTMLLAATGHERLAGALLNDVGPVLERAGLERIKNYVGRMTGAPTWVHAGRALAESSTAIFPDYVLADWIAMAKRLNRLTTAGRIVPDYDAAIAEPFKLPGGEAGVDLWPALEALTGVPTLVLRGERSDLLSETTAREMAERIGTADYAIVPRTGHAPTLDEPVSVTAIDRLLTRIT